MVQRANKRMGGLMIVRTTRSKLVQYEFWLDRILSLWIAREPEGWADAWADQEDIEFGAAL